jgi:hypothetical protein
VGESNVERRRLKRHSAAIPALVRSAKETWQAEVTSISKKGLAVRSVSLPPPGTQVRVVIKIPPDCRFKRHGKPIDSVEVIGSVRWTTDSRPRGSYRFPAFGFEIEEWSSDYQEFFERFLFKRASD